MARGELDQGRLVFFCLRVIESAHSLMAEKCLKKSRQDSLCCSWHSRKEEEKSRLWPCNSTAVFMCCTPRLQCILHVYFELTVCRGCTLCKTSDNCPCMYSQWKPPMVCTGCVVISPFSSTEHRDVPFRDHCMRLMDSPSRDEATSQFRVTCLSHSAEILGFWCSLSSSVHKHRKWKVLSSVLHICFSHFHV